MSAYSVSKVQISQNREDSLLEENTPSVQLPHFDGPLDLLLFLIRKNEINIHDIPIEKVTVQYLDVLHSMKTLNLDLAGEFFVMAATLLQIKSRMLLPDDNLKNSLLNENEEPTDPRWELVSQLVEYRSMKETAEAIELLIEKSNSIMPREVTSISSPLPQNVKPIDKNEIWNCFETILERLNIRENTTSLELEEISVEKQMELVLMNLRKYKEFYFRTIIPKNASITYVIVTFLSILEMTRQRLLNIRQNKTFDDIICRAL